MQEFVLVFVADGERFLVIEKYNPVWMRGKFNLVGGKVDPGEDHRDTAYRELKEETGLLAEGMEYYGLIAGTWGRVHCYKAYIPGDLALNPGEDEVEKLSWRSSSFLSDKRLMPNLRAIIPLFKSGVRDWTIVDEGSSEGMAQHSFNVTVPSFEHENLV